MHPPPKENPGSAPARATFIQILKQQSICQRCNEVCWIRDQSSLPHCHFLDVTQRSRKALHDIQKTAARETRITVVGSGIRDQKPGFRNQSYGIRGQGQTSGINTTLDLNLETLNLIILRSDVA